MLVLAFPQWNFSITLSCFFSGFVLKRVKFLTYLWRRSNIHPTQSPSTPSRPEHTGDVQNEVVIMSNGNNHFLVHSLLRSHHSLIQSRVRGKVNDSTSQNDMVLSHSAIISRRFQRLYNTGTTTRLRRVSSPLLLAVGTSFSNIVATVFTRSSLKWAWKKRPWANSHRCQICSHQPICDKFNGSSRLAPEFLWNKENC